MAQFETTGGGFIDSGDRQIIRKVYVATDGDVPTIPGDENGYRLTSYSTTREAAGIRRAVAEYSQGGAGSASYGYDDYGKRVELTGGTREVPIQTHEEFATMTEAEIAEVETRINNPELDVWHTTTTNDNPFTEKQQMLYNFLRRKVEYVLAPAVVGRVSEFESSLPDLSPIAKVANPPELNAPNGTFWICTAITASPIGTRFEVTREYTLSYAGWDDVAVLYGFNNE
jgi:hypothetical protein